MDSKDNKNAILAVLLSGAILFGWQYFFGAQPYEPTAQVTNTDVAQTEGAKTPNATTVIDNEAVKTPKLETLTLTNDKVEVVLNSQLNILNITDLKSKNDLKGIFTSYDNQLFFNYSGSNFKPNFVFTKVNDNSYKATDNKLQLSGTITLQEDGSTQFAFSSANPFIPHFNLKSKAQTLEDETKINSFVALGEDLEIVSVYEKESPGDSDEVEQFEQAITWFGLDFNYHLFGFILEKPLVSKLETRNNTLQTGPIGPAETFSYKVVLVKKNYDELKAMGNNLHKSVDFGMWEIVAVPLLRGLQYFFTWFDNYGVSIIILTILIRFLTFPLQYKSFKSMKKMQVIQPELKKIKEKFKDNPQKQQQETMALFKKAGANPLSGCLPMLLQMPIFFAFYKVLFTAVELVDAPFYFWIHDLSEKDPFYVLPVLMGLAMFLNMKLTPSTTTDPAQQKVMMLMPVMFSIFMINLPSGLTLYILVSTIVGMLQQLFVFKRT